MNKESLKILMIEDDSLDAELNREQILLLEEFDCEISQVHSIEKYQEAIESAEPPDLILCDYNLPQFTGMDILQDLKGRKLLIPFIFVTGAMQEEVAADAIKAGASDYVVKDRLFRLPLAIRGALQLRKERESSLNAEKNTQLILNAIEDTETEIIILDKSGIIEYANRNFCKTFQLNKDEVIGKHLRSMYDGYEIPEYSKNIREIVEREGKYIGEGYTKTPNGKMVYESMSFTQITTPGGEPGYIFIKQDITRQKEIEHELQESNKNYQAVNKELTHSLKHIESINAELASAKERAEESDQLKTAFLANLSHEIRTPMNGILGFASLLKEGDLSQETREKYLQMIEQSGQRMLKLIADLVDISRIEAKLVEVNNEALDLRVLMEKLYDFYVPQATSKGLKLIRHKEIPDKDTNVTIDKLKLEQIMSNLMDNAIKFTQRGEVHCGCKIKDSKLVFSVRDTGEGIPAEKINIIFERFRQADNTYLKATEGSGLGLSISKAFAELMGGSISVTSEPGVGSEFIVELPHVPASLPPEQNEENPDFNFTAGQSILIVEDEVTSALYLREVLKRYNFILHFAYNGEEAVSKFKEIKDLQLILMDMKMPIMNGVDATRAIRELNPDIPIIAQTAYAADSDRKNALAAGCNDFISKPVDKTTLLKKLSCFLGER